MESYKQDFPELNPTGTFRHWSARHLVLFCLILDSAATNVMKSIAGISYIITKKAYFGEGEIFKAITIPVVETASSLQFVHKC